MGDSDAIVRLLTEIRDNQREEIAWRRKVIEESVRLQRVAVSWQRVGLVIGGMAIAGEGLLFAYAMSWLGR